MQQGKATLPLLLACEENSELLDLVENVSQQQSPPVQDCLKIVQMVTASSAISRSIDRARKYVDRAQSELEKYQTHAATGILYQLSSSIIERIS